MALRRLKFSFLWAFSLLILSSAVKVNGQDSTFTQSEYVSFSSQNDIYQYWIQSDKHFTNGVHVEVSHKALKSKLADWILLSLKSPDVKQYTLSLSQDMHTPANPDRVGVDSTDRPYAGLLYLSYKKTSAKFWLGIKLNTSFFLGVQGPASGAGETQNFIHGITEDSPEFKGWSNQLSNGLILDYDVALTYLLPLSKKTVENSLLANVHVGSIYNFFTGGLQTKIGLFNDSYYNHIGTSSKQGTTITRMSKGKISKARKRQLCSDSLSSYEHLVASRVNRKWQVYLGLKIQSGVMLYDGTAQGSLIQFQENTYEYKPEQVDPFILNFAYSVNASYGRFMLNYSRFVERSQFVEGELFGFGEVRLTYSL